jgi:hypothetical protein
MVNMSFFADNVFEKEFFRSEKQRGKTRKICK